jgi:hypothetical protein
LQAWIAHSSPEDAIYESNRFTQHLLYWADRPHTTSAHVIIYDSEDVQNPYAPLEVIIADAWNRGASMLYTDGINDYYDDERLALFGASQQGIDDFFNSYRLEGPVFEYRENRDGPLKQVFRVLPPEPAD